MARNVVSFPNESQEYRRARSQHLNAERKLRREVEKVAALRRELPQGQHVASDYEFDEIDKTNGKLATTRLSELFLLPRKSLVVYSFMYARGGAPCPMCTAFLDAFNATALHAHTQINLAVITKGPIRKVTSWARKRGWTYLRMLSSGATTSNQDYLAELDGAAQIPMINVFRNPAVWYGISIRRKCSSAATNPDNIHVMSIWFFRYGTCLTSHGKAVPPIGSHNFPTDKRCSIRSRRVRFEVFWVNDTQVFGLSGC